MLEEMKVKDLFELISFLKLTKNEETKKYEGYKIVRTYSAGVFAGYIESRKGQVVIMRDARRLWKWAGAASLSQLAMEGTKDAENCKFPCAVDKVELLNVVEIIDCTLTSEKSIKEVKIWKN